jgi:hypothetical protein
MGTTRWMRIIRKRKPAHFDPAGLSFLEELSEVIEIDSCDEPPLRRSETITGNSSLMASRLPDEHLFQQIDAFSVPNLTYV